MHVSPDEFEFRSTSTHLVCCTFASRSSYGRERGTRRIDVDYLRSEMDFFTASTHHPTVPLACCLIRR